MASNRFRIRSWWARMLRAAFLIGSNRLGMARALDPGVRVSPRSLRRWREQYNAVGAPGLAGGPMALLDRYESGSRPV